MKMIIEENLHLPMILQRKSRKLSAIVLGIESTAHTAGVGIINSDGKILSNQRSMYIPEEGGIHPREAARHHSDTFPILFKKALRSSDIFTFPFSNNKIASALSINYIATMIYLNKT